MTNAVCQAVIYTLSNMGLSSLKLVIKKICKLANILNDDGEFVG